MNSARDPIRVRDDGPKTVKIKGLRLEVSAKPQRAKTNSMDSRSPVMKAKDQSQKVAKIKGAKIEFTSTEDKLKFIELVREVQGQFFPG